MKAKITVIPGDGIGPEVASQGQQVLETVAKVWGHQFEFQEALMGGIAIDKTGDPLPAATREACVEADAVLLGAVGGPKWDDPKAKVRPEQGLLGLRKLLSVYANLRPITVFPALRHRSPLKEHIVEHVDMLILRELTGGIYFGDKVEGTEKAQDNCVYADFEVARIFDVAIQHAKQRRGKLTSVDKANVLATSRLWRHHAQQRFAENPDLETGHVLVDAFAMHLIQRPADFDVVVTENMFGDILTDEASVISGSIGLLPSASLGDGPGLYEPIHGSAPDIAGQNKANPYGTILSCAMLLRNSLGLEKEAQAVEQAVEQALNARAWTADLTEDGKGISTEEAGQTVRNNLTVKVG